ncbi:alpha/beta fold hydrolase [Agrococcus sp. Marseille-Q4369]|uniref:alpha/beta fold hydrolase n=1 Tax=Agrococcus sp. Marseille-Q4369 TaxID=2810513 RepID=UPI001B8B1C3D|nr:alpha/beta fold hydrolase [Agrococcus sp. Marseille-Q4369]QUW18451.1 alpha/beta hydrolase [Agrococcus sp. Marseille-Q4369]
MLLAIHGLGSDSSAMRDYLGGAVPPGVRVLAPDLRAHGANPLIGEPADFALEALAAEVGDELVRFGDGSPVTIVGVSLGAALAAMIARSGRFPLDRVALVRPAFTHEPLPANLAIFPVIGRLLESHRPRRALAELHRAGAWRAIALESLAHARGLEAQLTQPRAAERRIRLLEIPRNAAYRPGELRIPAPTVVLASERDPVHPLHVAEAWRDELGTRMLVSPARDDGEAAMHAWFREQLGSFLVGIR